MDLIILLVKIICHMDLNSPCDSLLVKTVCKTVVDQPQQCLPLALFVELNTNFGLIIQLLTNQ